MNIYFAWEEWQNGRMEEWKNGRMEEWKNGRMEEWKIKLYFNFTLITAVGRIDTMAK